MEINNDKDLRRWREEPTWYKACLLVSPPFFGI
jgi:hypothetical protein